jgi:hypothetical protein
MVKHSVIKKKVVEQEFKSTLHRETIKTTIKDINGFVRIDPRFISAC